MKTGTAYYDLSRNPPTFNALDFLLGAERWRIEQGLDRIDVRILPGPQEGFRADPLPPYGGAERRRWFENIILPMPMLLPSCGAPAKLGEGDPGPEFGRGLYTVGPGAFKTAFQDSEARLHVPSDLIARRSQPFVTITLRNTGWWVERSSDREQWAIVGRALQDRGFHVVIIPDGAKPEEGIAGFENDFEAAQSVLVRAGLYAGAELNLGISNGPMWLCWFLGLPSLICKLINEKEPCAGTGTWRGMGVPPGTQPPHAKACQRLVWETDQADIVLRHADELLSGEHVVSADARAA